MVVNENALLKLMEKAYKSGGYHVAVGKGPFGMCYVVANYGYAWGVVIDQNRMPWSVLGLIVKHIGTIPQNGDAYMVTKYEVQTEEFDVAAKPNLGAVERAAAQVLPTLKRTALIFNGQNVWQRSDNLDVVLFNPDYEELALCKEAQAQMVDASLYVKGQNSCVFVGRVHPGDHEKNMVNHLGQIQWT